MNLSVAVSILVGIVLVVVILRQDARIDKLLVDKIVLLQMYQISNTDVIQALDMVAHIVQTHFKEPSQQTLLDADCALRESLAIMSSNRKTCEQLFETIKE